MNTFRIFLVTGSLAVGLLRDGHCFRITESCVFLIDDLFAPMLPYEHMYLLWSPPSRFVLVDKSHLSDNALPSL